MRKKDAWYILGLFIAIAIGALGNRIVSSFHRHEYVTLTSLSPDDKFRVSLVGLPELIDRDFELRLEELARPGQMRTLFSSPDEGRPEGSERIVWSKDSRRFFLLGRHFFVGTDAVFSNGEQLYLMCDIGTGEVRCNARQAKFPHVSITKMRELEGESRDPK